MGSSFAYIYIGEAWGSWHTSYESGDLWDRASWRMALTGRSIFKWPQSSFIRVRTHVAKLVFMPWAWQYLPAYNLDSATTRAVWKLAVWGPQLQKRERKKTAVLVGRTTERIMGGRWCSRVSKINQSASVSIASYHKLFPLFPPLWGHPRSWYGTVLLYRTYQNDCWIGGFLWGGREVKSNNLGSDAKHLPYGEQLLGDMYAAGNRACWTQPPL